MDERCDILNVRGHGVAENQQLNDRHQKDDALHPGISKDLDELLNEHVFDAFPHNHTSFFLNFRLANSTIAAPNTVSRPASNARMSSPIPFRKIPVCYTHLTLP